MNITKIRVKLVDDPDNRLRAFCSITIDDAFVIRDVKIIEGPSGRFVAMPSRKITVRCEDCGTGNPLRGSYCSHCGQKMSPYDKNKTVNRVGRNKEHADIVHPINSECRNLIQSQVLAAFLEETELAKAPDYTPRTDVTGEDQTSKRHRIDGGKEKSQKGPVAPPRSRESKDSET